MLLLALTLFFVACCMYFNFKHNTIAMIVCGILALFLGIMFFRQTFTNAWLHS